MYNYENYAQVKGEIEKRRVSAQAAADGRAEELREKSSEIRKIDEELSATGRLLFKAALSGEDVTPIRERNLELNRRRRELITKLGYPENYTDVNYFCSDCSDTGYLPDGRVCHCLKEELIKASIASSGIGSLIDRQSFDNFSTDIYKDDPAVEEHMKKVVAVAKKFVSSFNEKKENLLLIGGTGTGKTHISTAIAKEIISKGYDVIYDSIQNIISDFETDKFKSGYSQTEPKSDKYLECDLLIIDDLGTEFITPFSLSCIYNLINTRQNRALPTIISTNLSAKEISQRYEDRIYSRIMGKQYRPLQFVGPDRRIN